MTAVTASTLMELVPMLRRLEALTPDQDDSPLYFDGDLPIYHRDDWLVGIARFQDDQWWVDFTNYGADRPPHFGRSTDQQTDPSPDREDPR